MRVAYDISELGLDFGRPQIRRGVNRVVEKVCGALLQVAQQDPDALQFVVTGVDSSATVAAYLRSQPLPALAAATFLNRPVHRHWTAVQARTQVIVDDLSDRSLPRRLTRWALSRSLPWQRRLTRRLPAFDPEAVDVYHSAAVTPFPAYVRRARRPAGISTFYDLIPMRHPEMVHPASLDNLRQMLATFGPEHFGICISQHVKDDLCDFLRLDPGHLFVAPLAADTARFHRCADTAEIAAVRCRLLPDAEAPYFLSLCTLERRKNLLHLIRCFARLQRENPVARTVRLVLAGFVLDAVRQQIESIVAAEKLAGQVVLTGYVPDADLAPLYSGALAFVFPSLAEGFGLPPLEAMQCGAPVICSDRTSLPEVVGDAGILVDPEDEDALCDAMQQVLDGSALREELSRRGLARAGRFSWQRCAADHLVAYRAAVQIKRGVSAH